jgi:hypothetical protein
VRQQHIRARLAGSELPHPANSTAAAISKLAAEKARESSPVIPGLLAGTHRNPKEPDRCDHDSNDHNQQPG